MTLPSFSFVLPLCRRETKEEEDADEDDEGDGAADVGHRPHRGDGDGHRLLRGLHSTIARSTPANRFTAPTEASFVILILFSD